MTEQGLHQDGASVRLIIAGPQTLDIERTESLLWGDKGHFPPP